MLDTFKARLKAVTKASGVNLSKKRLDAMATKLHTKYPDVTEEAEHDTHINDVYDVDIFKEIKALDDYQRTIEAQSATETEETKPETPKPAAQPKPKPADDVPAWAQALIDQNKALSEKINGIEKEKAVGSIKQKLAEKLKDVPGSIWSKRALPESEDAIDAFVTEVETDYKTDFVDKGLITQPAGGSKSGLTGKATKEEIKSIVDGIMPRN